MSAQLLEKLTSLGKDLGYTGVDLREWVMAQIKAEESKQAAVLDREERRLNIEDQQREIVAKAQQAREESKAIFEAEKADKNRAERLRVEEISLERQRLENEKLQNELKLAEVKLAEKRLEKEHSQAGSDSDGEASVAGSTNAHSVRGKSGPKLPHFDEAKNNVDSYLRRFERYASLQGWPQTDWAIYMSARLKGKTLEVYSRMTEGESCSYDKLKAAILRKYQLTADGFRKQFYDAKREKEETASQFICRITGYLDRWIQLAEIEQSFQGLKDLIVKEQFLTVSEEHLTLYLRERDPKQLDDMIKLADMYLDARIHRDRNISKKFKDNSNRIPFSSESERPARKTTEDKQVQNKAEVNGDKTQRVCYLCHQPGHVRKNCRLNQRSSRGSTDVVAACSDSSSCDHNLPTPGMLQLQCGCSMPFVG